jgi:hypothetical protein
MFQQHVDEVLFILYIHAILLRFVYKLGYAFWLLVLLWLFYVSCYFDICKWYIWEVILKGQWERGHKKFSHLLSNKALVMSLYLSTHCGAGDWLNTESSTCQASAQALYSAFLKFPDIGTYSQYTLICEQMQLIQ